MGRKVKPYTVVLLLDGEARLYVDHNYAANPEEAATVAARNYNASDDDDFEATVRDSLVYDGHLENVG